MKYDLSYFDKIDTLPYAQNVTTTFTRLAVGELGLYYTDVRRSLGAVDDEKGVAWSLVGDASEVQGKTIPQLRGGIAFGAQTGAHTSIWLYSDAGLGGGDRNNPVANYYFGGFGNNYVDSGSIKRYHDFYSMPCFGINEIAGQSFVREVLEFNVPPIAFDAAGTPAFHAAWLRPSLFVAGLWTDPGRHDFRRDYQDIGVQTDLHFSVLHWSELTLSLGYAVGFTEGKRSGDEFMISLKILER